MEMIFDSLLILNERMFGWGGLKRWYRINFGERWLKENLETFRMTEKEDEESKARGTEEEEIAQVVDKTTVSLKICPHSKPST